MSDFKDLLDEAVGPYSPRGDEDGIRRRVRGRQLRRRLSAATVGIVVFIGAGWFAWTRLRPQADDVVRTGEGQPVYYVDGARPPDVSISGPVPETAISEYCVPYSAERPDIHICPDDEELPPGWQPPPAPYFDEAICDAALGWMRTSEEKEYASAPVDPASCLVAESSGDQLWDVIFARDGDGGNVHVPYDPTGANPWAAHPR